MLSIFKKHDIKLYRIIIIGIIVFCAAIIIAVSSLAYIFSERYYRESTIAVLNDPYVNLREQERGYEKEIKTIFEKYKGISKNDKEKLETLKSELLDVTVPASYRDEHFRMIVALEGLSKNDDVKKANTQADLLKKNAVWLSELLKKFILNNW